MPKKLSSIKDFIFRHKILSTIAVVIIVGGFLFYRSSQKKAFTSESKIEYGTVTEILTLSGQVAAVEHAKLRFSSSGIISVISVKEGQEVKKGQFLGSIDQTLLSANLVIARSNLRAAEAAVEKIHDDVKGHDKDETFAQKTTRTDAEVAKDNAFDAVRIAEKNLRDARLFSPFAGFVTKVTYPYTGINVNPTEVAFEILNPKTLYFEVAADQTEVNKIKVGQKVDVALDAAEGKKIAGLVKNISLTPEEGEVGSVYKVTVSISFPEEIRVGMSGDAKFVLSQKDHVLLVPSEFINNSPEGTYLKTNFGKDKLFVEVGIEGEDKTEITGDIAENLSVYD